MLVIYTEISFREFKCGENWTKIADILFEGTRTRAAQKVLQLILY